MVIAARDRALIVGGGYAGLVVARVLADRFGEVVIVEQDRITADTTHRRGIPQSHHPHGMLARGGKILEELFPGLRTELAKRGAPVVDFGEGSRILYPGGWSPRTTTGVVVQIFSRGALESAIRRHVLARPEVTLIDGVRVGGLLLDPTQRRVIGVCGEDNTRYTADLVVDASGRLSRLPQWLRTAGLPAPRVQTVEGKLSYTSRLYQRGHDADRDWQVSIEATYAPSVRRGGAVSAIEDGRWIVSLLGAGGDSAPTADEGFAAYAATLKNPHIHEVIDTATPAGPIHRYAGLDGQWRRYDQLQPLLCGILVLGDALCALNPLYGQGMTIAAMQALLLAHTLDTTDAPNVAGRFQRRSANTLRPAWSMSSSLDLGWNPERASMGAALVRWYLGRILARIPQDPKLYRRFVRVQHMMASPDILLAPSSLRRRATAGRTA
jgi:2-polyprenyl-6-methoxyphenol hydroxylase-like FAD-dependent oxidoreductase